MAYIVLPGGFGTLDELFEIITLVQTKKKPPVPIVLVGTRYWAGLIDWIKAQPLTHKLIGEHDLGLLTLCDDIDSIMQQTEAACGDHTTQTDTTASPAPHAPPQTPRPARTPPHPPQPHPLPFHH